LKRAQPQINRLTVFRKDNFCCVYCGSLENLTVDHILPKANGGSNALENLQTLCKTCNDLKSDAIVVDVAAFKQKHAIVFREVPKPTTIITSEYAYYCYIQAILGKEAVPEKKFTKQIMNLARWFLKLHNARFHQ